MGSDLTYVASGAGWSNTTTATLRINGNDMISWTPDVWYSGSVKRREESALEWLDRRVNEIRVAL